MRFVIDVEHRRVKSSKVENKLVIRLVKVKS